MSNDYTSRKNPVSVPETSPPVSQIKPNKLDEITEFNYNVLQEENSRLRNLLSIEQQMRFATDKLVSKLQEEIYDLKRKNKSDVSYWNKEDSKILLALMFSVFGFICALGGGLAVVFWLTKTALGY